MAERVVTRGAERYNEAHALIHLWLADAQALALLNMAMQSGVLDATCRSNIPADIAASTGIEQRAIEDICFALDAHGVLAQTREGYHLTPNFAFLMSRDAPQSLSNILRAAEVKLRVMSAASSSVDDYTGLATEDVLAMALGASIVPWSASGLALLAEANRAVPELENIWMTEARHLEVGCGVGGALIGQLLLHPTLHAVGIEINGEAIAEARRRAMAMGVADRAELRHVDACVMDDEATYDSVAWSQFYFSTPQRALVLEAIRRALKPGGYLLMPLMSEQPATVDELHSADGRTYAINRLVFGRWGIPLMDSVALRAEVETAGFAMIRVVAVPPFRMLLTRRR